MRVPPSSLSPASFSLPRALMTVGGEAHAQKRRVVDGQPRAISIDIR